MRVVEDHDGSCRYICLTATGEMDVCGWDVSGCAMACCPRQGEETERPEAAVEAKQLFSFSAVLAGDEELGECCIQGLANNRMATAVPDSGVIALWELVPADPARTTREDGDEHDDESVTTEPSFTVRPIRLFERGSDRIEGLASAYGGTHLISYGTGGRVRLWNCTG